MIIPLVDFTSSVLTALRDGITFGPPVYDYEVPTTPPGAYAVLYQIPGGSLTGPGLGAQNDAAVAYQVDAVGRRRDQAQYLADRIREIIFGQDTNGRYSHGLTTPAGWVSAARLATDGLPGVYRDPSAPTPLYQAVQRFTVVFTPQ